MLRLLAIGGFLAVTQMALVDIPYFWIASHTSEYLTGVVTLGS